VQALGGEEEEEGKEVMPQMVLVCAYTFVHGAIGKLV